jgi:hypothetical protein
MFALQAFYTTRWQPDLPYQHSSHAALDTCQQSDIKLKLRAKTIGTTAIIAGSMLHKKHRERA